MCRPVLLDLLVVSCPLVRALLVASSFPRCAALSRPRVARRCRRRGVGVKLLFCYGAGPTYLCDPRRSCRLLLDRTAHCREQELKGTSRHNFKGSTTPPATTCAVGAAPHCAGCYEATCEATAVTLRLWMFQAHGGSLPLTWDHVPPSPPPPPHT